MASTRKESAVTPRKPRRRAATTPEGREIQMVALAVDEAERQIRNHEASSQVIVHYLKLGSTRERREQRRMELEADLLQKKMETMESAKRVEELYEEALKAMRTYQGDTTDVDFAGFDD